MPSPAPNSRLGGGCKPANVIKIIARIELSTIVRTMYFPMPIGRPVRSSRAISMSRLGSHRRATLSILVALSRLDSERAAAAPVAAAFLLPLRASTRCTRRREPAPSIPAATSRNPAPVISPMTSAARVTGSRTPGMAQITSSSARSKPKYSARGRKAGRMPLDWKAPRSLPSEPSPWN